MVFEQTERITHLAQDPFFVEIPAHISTNCIGNLLFGDISIDNSWLTGP